MARATFWILLLTGALCAALLFVQRWLSPPLLGQAYVALVVLYNLLLLMGAWLRSQHELFQALLFLLPLSMFQVLPDAMLVQQLGVLGFPDFGAPRFGPVPAYMAGLWVAPLLLVVWAAEVVHARSVPGATLVALLMATAVFGTAEWAVQWLPLWHARGVATWHGIAIYVVPPEALLGLATWWVYTQVQHRTIFMKVAGAAAVSMFYAGALLASHLAVQRFR